MLLLAYEIG